MPLLHRAVAREVLWRRGNLAWKLHKGQEVIEAAYKKVTKKLFVANCARRFGKTYWNCVKAVEKALTCENTLPRIKVAASTRTELREFIIPSFELILQDCPEDIAPRWVSSESKYVFDHNGAEIQLIGLDKSPDGGRGNYCDLYIFEEAGFIANLLYLYSSVVAPMTLRRPGARIIMSSTAPPTPAHPFQEFCERAQKQGAYVELNIYANPLMTPEDIEEAKAECLDESEWLREYMCQFVVDKTRAVTPEWSDDLVGEVERPVHFNYLHRYVAMDLGVKVDLTAIVFGYYNPSDKRLIIEDEADISGPTMTTLGLRDLIRQKESLLWPMLKPYRRVADNNNPLLLQDLGSLHGLHFVSTGKDELAAMINELRLMLKGKRILVSPKCVKTLGCLRYAIWNKKRSALDRSNLYGHFDHLMALVYLVRNLDQNTDPIPRLAGVATGGMHVRPLKKRKGIEDKIKKIVNI